MPTGYTATIKDGITFKQFFLRCARGMGALAPMRDEPWDAPIPERFEPSEWHFVKAKKEREELARLNAITPEQADEEAEAAYLDAMAKRAEHIQETSGLRRKYEAMLDKVKAWEPPTPEHVGFSEFMTSQIEESIKWDCMICIDEPKRVDGSQWLHEQIKEAERRIAYHDGEYIAEVDRTEKRNAWINALRGSLK